MARRPHHQQRRNEWVHTFVGTPRRFLWSAFALFVLFAIFFPSLAAQAAGNVLGVFIDAVGPSAGPLLTIAIAFGAIWFLILRPFTTKKKKGDS